MTGGTITGTCSATHREWHRDASELSLAGVTVFADANANGIFDPGEVSTKSGADGTYSLTVGRDGTFRPVQVEPLGFATTTADPAPVAISGGVSVKNVNFGDKRTLAPDQSFVDQVFRDLLGRGADAGALSFFGGALDQGSLERSQVSQVLEASNEFRVRQIDELFTRLLHRSADASANQAFLGALPERRPSLQIENNILASLSISRTAEAAQCEGFATALFQDELARNIDSAASCSCKTSWLPEAAGRSSRKLWLPARNPMPARFVACSSNSCIATPMPTLPRDSAPRYKAEPLAS